MADSSSSTIVATLARTAALGTRYGGGTYIPPARLAIMQREELNDALRSGDATKASDAHQRVSWDALKKSLNGLINKNIVIELFSENLIRGRGLFVRSLLKAQSASLPFTHVFAALISIINSKIPIIGELLLSRLILQFRRSFRRNDKVAHEVLALELLTLLLENPTDDSVEIAVGFIRECGAHLTDVASKATNAIFERFRAILLEAQVDVRIQWMIQVLFQIRKDKFKDNIPIAQELDLVEEEDRITHLLSLDDDIQVDDSLVIFRYDDDFEENEKKYCAIREDILGEVEDPSRLDSAAEEQHPQEEPLDLKAAMPALVIRDKTNTNIINLRKAVYLTVMSSLEFEECCHKLLKLAVPEGLEIEVSNMIIECCSQEKAFTKFYGLLSERFCKLNQSWMAHFEASFVETYTTIHRLETNKIRNIAYLFSHILATDAISWNVFNCIKLTEEDTTSAGRIFIKFLLQELSLELGPLKLKSRFFPKPVAPDQFAVEPVFEGLFPKEDPRNTRFAINFYTAINLGQLTDEMRAYLKWLMDIAAKEI
ncbi:pre-mRNA-splicing factor cwc22 [Mitosporidium daphniae]